MDTDSTRARELIREAAESRHQGRDDLAHTQCGESLFLSRRAGDRVAEARVLLTLADLALHYNPSGEDAFGRRKRLAEESLAISREIADAVGASAALRILSSVCPKEAESMLEEALALAESAGDRKQAADTLERMAARVGLCDRHKALNLAERALGLYREIGDRAGEAQSLFSLCIRTMGDERRSRDYARESLGIYRELGHRKQIAQLLMFLWVAPSTESAEGRESGLLECRELCREMGIPCWEASCLQSLADIAEARGASDSAAAMRAEAERIDDSPKLDTETMKALEEAFDSEDPDAHFDAVRGAFGGDLHAADGTGST